MSLIQCPAVNPATGNRCTRPANGHADHQTEMGDGVTQTWAVRYQATFNDNSLGAVSRTPLAPVVGKDGKEYE